MGDANRTVMIAAIALFALIVNLPFGYLRTKTRKFSLQWFLCIHMPIPLIVAIRLYSGLSYKFIPVFLIASITGQIFGGHIRRNNLKQRG